MLAPAANTVPADLKVAEICCCSKIKYMKKVQPDIRQSKCKEFKWKSGVR